MLPYRFDIIIHNRISNPDLIEHIDREGKLFYRRNDSGGNAINGA